LSSSPSPSAVMLARAAITSAVVHGRTRMRTPGARSSQYGSRFKSRRIISSSVELVVHSAARRPRPGRDDQRCHTRVVTSEPAANDKAVDNRPSDASSHRDHHAVSFSSSVMVAQRQVAGTDPHREAGYRLHHRRNRPVFRSSACGLRSLSLFPARSARLTYAGHWASAHLRDGDEDPVQIRVVRGRYS
jgi:hypothetical protein